MPHQHLALVHVFSAFKALSGVGVVHGVTGPDGEIYTLSVIGSWRKGTNKMINSPLLKIILKRETK